MVSWKYSIEDEDFIRVVRCTSSDGETGTIVNLCDHPVKIMNSNGDTIEIPASGIVARADKKTETSELFGFDVQRDVYKEIHGLPKKKEGYIYIVSAPLVNAINDSRNDVFALGKQTTLSSEKIARGLRRKF